MSAPTEFVPAGMDAARLVRFVFYLATYGGMIENVEGQAVQRSRTDELLDLVLRLELAWRQHPDHYATCFPPAAMSVWKHEAFQGHDESYMIAGLDDVTSPASLKRGKRTFGEYAGVRAVPADLPVHPQRIVYVSYSLKGAGKAFRARLELKRLLPAGYRGLVSKARHFAREKKYIAYKALVGGLNPAKDADYNRTPADEYRFRLFSQHYADRLAGLENYIGLRQFWRCATGQVHPEHVINLINHQRSLL